MFPGLSKKNTNHLVDQASQHPRFQAANSMRRVSGIISFQWIPWSLLSSEGHSLCSVLFMWLLVFVVGAIVGVGCFKMISRFHTTTNFTADEIHALGIKEVIHFSLLLLQNTWIFVQHWSQVASIEEEMREVITELNLDLTVKEFVSKLRNDPANYFGSDSTLESP